MSKIRRVDYSPDEFLSGTSDLTMAEKGGYWVVCSLIYSRGGPIPDDDRWIATVAGCSTRMWGIVRARLLEVGKLQSAGGLLSNKRAASELLRAENRVNIAREAAETSARIRRERREKDRLLRETNGLAQADATHPREANKEPSTKNHQPTKNKEEIDTPLPVAEAMTPAVAVEWRNGVPDFTTAMLGTARAETVPAEWQPSPAAKAQLQNARPDITPEVLADREIQFRLWCATHNTTTHNRDATWLGFMLRTREIVDAKQQLDDNRRQRPTELDGVAAAFARRYPELR